MMTHGMDYRLGSHHRHHRNILRCTMQHQLIGRFMVTLLIKDYYIIIQNIIYEMYQ